MCSKSLSAQRTNFVNITFITVSESKYKKSLAGEPLLVTKQPWWFCVRYGQARRQDLAAGGPKTRRRGQKTEGGAHF